MSNFTMMQRQNILNKSFGVCSHCEKELNLQSMTIDHYIPVSKGGKSVINNLFPLCKECNRLKDNEIVLPEFYKYIHPIYEDQAYNLYWDYIDKKTAEVKHKTDSIVITYKNKIMYNGSLLKKTVKNGCILIGDYIKGLGDKYADCSISVLDIIYNRLLVESIMYPNERDNKLGIMFKHTGG